MSVAQQGKRTEMRTCNAVHTRSLHNLPYVTPAHHRLLWPSEARRSLLQDVLHRALQGKQAVGECNASTIWIGWREH